MGRDMMASRILCDGKNVGRNHLKNVGKRRSFAHKNVMSFNDPYDRSNSPNRVCCYSPEGDAFLSHCGLPKLPIPSRVIVTDDYIEFDGWVFPLYRLTKGTLLWIRESVDRWMIEDDREENDRWVRGFVEALEKAACKKFTTTDDE
jgi:hypothetical protein